MNAAAESVWSSRSAWGNRQDQEAFSSGVDAQVARPLGIWEGEITAKKHVMPMWYVPNLLPFRFAIQPRKAWHNDS